MLHWPINELSIAHYAPGQKEAPPTSEEFFAALSAVQKEGLVRTIGISNFGVKQMQEALATGAAIAVNELTYNIVSRAIETDIAGFCEKNSISIIGSMALQQGLLTGKYAAPEEVPPPQAHSRHFHHTRGGEQSRHGEEGAEEEIFQVVALLKQLSAETGRTPGSIAIAWVLSKKFIASALVGCRSLGQLEANIAASAIELPHDIIQRIDEVSLPALNKLGSSPDYYENRKKSRSF
jgi:aryl-alcohol dehydrogenase-like predicted oxidoreductase